MAKSKDPTRAIKDRIRRREKQATQDHQQLQKTRNKGSRNKGRKG